MQKPDKTPEPSMEEILASIRKIIAEEPIGSRPGPDPEPRGPALATPSPLPGAAKPSDPSEKTNHSPPSRNERGSGGPPFNMDDALADLMDDPPLPRFATAPGRQDPAPKPPSRAAATPEEDSQRPSWLFARPGDSPAQTGSQHGSEGNRGAGLLGQLDSIRPLPQSGGSAGETLAPKPAAAQKVAAPEPLFDRQKEAERPALGGAAPSPADLLRPGARISPVDDGDAGRRPDGQASAASAAPAGTDGSRPEPFHRQPTSAPAPAEESKPKSAEFGITPAERAPREQPRVESPVAEKPASLPGADRPPRAETSPLASLAQGLASAASGANLDTGKSEAGTSPKPGAAASGPAVRTLEDTVAELLRPMLRDWLDANMPRIVEKALKVELSDSAKRSGSAD